MKKTLIFDFDGTLADSADLMIECANALAAKYHYPIIENPHQHKDKPARYILKELLQIPWYRIPFYIRDMKNLFKSKLQHVEIFEGIPEALESLSKRYRLGLLSTNNSETIHRILKRYSIDQFDFISADSALFGKHKEIKKILKRYKLSLNDTLYIGDELRDIEATRKIGMKIGVVGWGLNSVHVLKSQNPAYLFQTPDELANINF